MDIEAKDIRTDGKRRYSAEDTKAVLMENALRAFTAAGFDDVGVREIAQAAGVNPSLVNRYFGSKQGLFEAMLDQMPSAQDFMGPDQGQWGAQIAKMLVVKIGKEPDIDPLLIMLRSAQSKGVGALVHRIFGPGLRVEESHLENVRHERVVVLDRRRLREGLVDDHLLEEQPAESES